MSDLKSVTAFAPGSVGNAGIGFDIMGFAVTGIGDKVTVELSDENSYKIKLTGKYGNLIPEERNKNTAGVAIDAFLRSTGKQDLKLKITLEKNMPLGSGLGSSASSAAAAVFAINELTGSILTTKKLIPFAMKGEEISCGTAHADNVAPSLLGGFILIRSNDPLDIIKIPVPKDLFCAVVHPHYELLTSTSRSVVKKEINLSVAIQQNANTSAFISSLFLADYDLMKKSFVELFAEPYRSKLIPGYNNVKISAMNAGAIGCGISGSGPSVIALCRGEEDAKRISAFIDEEFSKVNLDSDIIVSPVDAPGAVIVDKN